MRLDINLASQPYEDARQFWMRWGTAVGVAGLFTLVLLSTTITGFVNARRDHKTMSEKQGLIAERDQIRANAEAFLNRPENRTTRDESQVLNQLIERKAFSWTLVLESLEKVMPTRVHLISINPELDEDNQLALKMVVGGDSRERAIELARRMEDSRRFAQTNIIYERPTQSQAGDTEQFDIAAIYIPEKEAENPPTAKSEAKTETKSTTGASTTPAAPGTQTTPAHRKNPGSAKPSTKGNH